MFISFILAFPFYSAYTLKSYSSLSVNSDVSETLGIELDHRTSSSALQIRLLSQDWSFTARRPILGDYVWVVCTVEVRMIQMLHIQPTSAETHDRGETSLGKVTVSAPSPARLPALSMSPVCAWSDRLECPSSVVWAARVCVRDRSSTRSHRTTNCHAGDERARHCLPRQDMTSFRVTPGKSAPPALCVPQKQFGTFPIISVVALVC